MTLRNTLISWAMAFGIVALILLLVNIFWY